LPPDADAAADAAAASALLMPPLFSFQACSYRFSALPAIDTLALMPLHGSPLRYATLPMLLLMRQI